MGSKELLRSVVGRFPPVRLAVAYGSAVFPQHAPGVPVPPEDRPMLDLIFGVQDAKSWHAANMKLPGHWDHYSDLSGRRLGPEFVTFMQELSCGVFYNTMIDYPMPTQPNLRIKYGVITMDRLCKELENWDNFYMSGRLQKPVTIIQDDEQFAKSNDCNLRAALTSSILLLPQEFTETQLYLKIAGLSYFGDFRMGVGEHPRKVENIVKNNMADFQRVYKKHLEFALTTELLYSSGLSIFRKTENVQRIAEALTTLPIRLRRKLYLSSTGRFLGSSQKDQIRLLRLANRPYRTKLLLQFGIKTTVARNSAIQSLKGILTGGLIKSYNYALRKVKKSFKK